MRYCKIPASHHRDFETLKQTYSARLITFHIFPSMVENIFNLYQFYKDWNLIKWSASFYGFIKPLLKMLLHKTHMGNRVFAFNGKKHISNNQHGTVDILFFSHVSNQLPTCKAKNVGFSNHKAILTGYGHLNIIE